MTRDTTIIQRLVKEAIDNYNKEIKQITANINLLTESLKSYYKDIQDATEELRKLCKHEKSHRVEGVYIPAGYDYVSESNYTIVCDNCGKILESKLIRGTTFG